MTGTPVEAFLRDGLVRSFLGLGNYGGSLTEFTDPYTGQHTKSAKKMANIQNQYYVDKVSTIKQKLPKLGDPIKTLQYLVNKRPQPRQEGFIFNAVSL